MIRIEPINNVQQKIQVPGDKSISHRALMLLSIGNGQGKIKGLLKSADVLATLHAVQSMGIEIIEEEDGVVVNGKGLYGLQEPTNVLDLGNSGTTMRLLSGILVGQSFPSVLTGDDSLRNRPMDRIIEPLRKIGANIHGRAGNRKAPLVILESSLQGGTYHGELASAQVKSSLLLASLYQKGSFAYVEPQRTRDHTERMMKYLGIPLEVEGKSVTMRGMNGSVEREGPNNKEKTGNNESCNHPLNNKEFIIQQSNTKETVTTEAKNKELISKEFVNKDLEIPGDISSAAFFIALVAGRPGFEILIENVGINPTRIGILNVFKDMGADITVLNERNLSGEPVGDIRVRGKKLKNIPITKDWIPSLIDELPIIAVIASQAEGDMEVSGAAELKVKESDRIAAVVEEMGKLGVKIEEKSDGMVIYGGQRILGGKVNSHQDHRIAMSMVIAGLLSGEGVSLTGEECIDVSFPGFFSVIEQLR